jgi:hypothetical protein
MANEFKGIAELDFGQLPDHTCMAYELRLEQFGVGFLQLSCRLPTAARGN